ncbi:hypothetical protein HMPREF1502_0162 [Klebsiella sp. AS10]|nr:hypothetical protein HMPREF1502_0162 [Klebsiella sp. AS10]
MWSRILAAKKLLSNIYSPSEAQLAHPSTNCRHYRQFIGKNALQD